MSESTDALHLITALALPADLAPALSAALDAVGGLWGLRGGGAAALDDVLEAPDRARLEAVLGLIDQLIAPPSLPEMIGTAEEVAAFFGPRLAHERVESFWVLALDARCRPIGHHCIARGTVNACLVHPREVFGAAIRARASQIVVVHNHPSGDPTPSDDDLALTERLTESGGMLGIPLIDHVIVAATGHRSIGLPMIAEPLEPIVHGRAVD